MIRAADWTDQRLQLLAPDWPAVLALLAVVSLLFLTLTHRFDRREV